MSIDKEKLKLLLLDQAHEWLEHFDKTELRLSSQILILQMQRALSRDDHEQVHNFIERLIALSDKTQNSSSLDNFAPSIIRIKCALAAYQMKNYDEAISLLEKAIPVNQGFKGLHLEGTIKYMLGCIQWQLPNQSDFAIVSWEETIRIYRELQKLNSDTHVIRRSTWYSTRLDEIATLLEEALDQPEPPPSPSTFSETPATHLSPDSSAHTSGAMSGGDFLRLFSVKDEISAGGSRVGDRDYDSFGYVEINEFQIDGSAHYLINLLNSGRVVKTMPGWNYEVVRVKGESMTAEGIDDGDYILLRIQETAKNNDIVAARIIKVDAEATLKKFLIEKNKIILRFRSNNPIYKEDDGRDMEFQFDESTFGEFQIVGVAIAVFKPLNATR